MTDKAEQRREDFARASEEWLWETDAEHRFTWFSDRFEELTAVSAALLIGKNRLDLTFKNVDEEKRQEHLADLAARKPYRDFRFMRRGQDGRQQFVTSSGVPVFDDKGDFIGYRGTGRNISNAVEVEHQLSAAKNHFMVAIESVSDGFALFDPDDWSAPIEWSSLNVSA